MLSRGVGLGVNEAGRARFFAGLVCAGDGGALGRFRALGSSKCSAGDEDQSTGALLSGATGELFDVSGSEG